MSVSVRFQRAPPSNTSSVLATVSNFGRSSGLSGRPLLAEEGGTHHQHPLGMTKSLRNQPRYVLDHRFCPNRNIKSFLNYVYGPVGRLDVDERPLDSPSYSPGVRVPDTFAPGVPGYSAERSPQAPGATPPCCHRPPALLRRSSHTAHRSAVQHPSEPEPEWCAGVSELRAVSPVPRSGD